MAIRVKTIYRFPIKSCRGHTLDEALIGPRGIMFDREFLIVDERGMFVSQRSGNTYGNIGIRSMCLVTTKFEGNFLCVNAPDMSTMRFHINAPTGRPLKAQVWGSVSDAVEVSVLASDWFSDYLGRERPGRYRLVQMGDGFRRAASGGDAEVGFADGYPFLIASEESLNELNRRMSGLPVGMDRFRPNIVISGCDRPHAEDSMDRIRINDVEFVGMDLCDRCPIPGINQVTGEKDGRALITLAKYRKTRPGSDKVQFGRNLNHLGNGRIRVGDEVVVL